MKNVLPFLPVAFARANYAVKLLMLACTIVLCFNNDVQAGGHKPGVKTKPGAALPAVSYAGPKIYTAGTTITPLAPTSSGVLAAAYNNGTVNFATGFTHPRSIARDAQGNVYVADYGTSTVVKIPAGGGARTTIGSGFNGLAGVAVDGFGNVFVEDIGNSAIKEIAVHTNTTTTLATGFSNPLGIAADAQGNVYVADYPNAEVKKIPVGSNTPEIIGSSSNFQNPSGVAVDAGGNVYVTDLTGNSVKEILAAGGPVVTLASGLSTPYGLTVDPSGNLFIADGGSTSIKEIPAGGGSPIVISSAFTTVVGVVADASGNLLVADYGNTAIQLLTPAGGYYINKALPAGLSFNSNTGVISGTPLAASPATSYTVSAYNASGVASASVSIRVILPQTPSLSYGSAKTYTSGTAITNLVPTASRVAAAAYSNIPETIASGFQNPAGISLDANDNIYTADFNTGIIYEILDGSNTAVAIASGFSNPQGVAADEAGNVYVTDRNNNTVSRIPAGGGAVTLVASGYNAPDGIAVDEMNNVYVTNYGNSFVEKIPAGSNSTVILTSSGQTPLGVTTDAAGNVYYSNVNGGNYELLKIPAAGGQPFVIANGFFDPTAITSDLAGNVYVADELYSAIKKVPANGGPATILGSGILFPSGIAIDEAGNIFVTDGGAHTIRKIAPVGGYFITPALPAGLTFDSNTGIISGTPLAPAAATDYLITAYNAGGFTEAIINIKVNAPAAPIISYTGPNTYTAAVAIAPLTPTSARVAAPLYSNSPIAIASGFHNVGGIARDATGNIYVADIDNFAVKKIPAGGGAVTTIGSGFGLPVGVAIDAAGNVFVLDKGNNDIIKIPAGGGANTTVASGLNSPSGLTSDAAGNLYVTNSGSNVVNKIPAGGGSPVVIGSGFSGPSGIAVDAYGNVYVGDSAGGNYTVKEIPVSGGTPIVLANGFFDPAALATDAAGNIYVADELNNALKRIPAGGGTAVIISSGVLYPAGVVIDPTGNLYVSDNGTNAVDKIVPTGGYFITPALPAGLTFNSATGVISGTPTAASVAANYIINAYNSGGSGAAIVSIAVMPSSNATLSSMGPSITPLSPVFNPTTTSYTLSVSNTIATMTVKPVTADAGATIKVNGTALSSGTTSAPIALAEGAATAINVVVTAADATTTKTYTIMVTRAPSAVATLSAIGSSITPLTPVFNSATTSYTLSVGNTTATMTVQPVTTDVNATIKVNGTTVTSGTTSAPIALAEGAATVVNVVVTAQNGTTVKTYAITVTRAPSSVATLSVIGSSITPLTPVFNPNTTSYNLSVSHGTTSMTLKPVTTDANATVKVNGTAITSGTTTSPIALAAGSNTITTVVTAQDGTTIKTYTITVTRASGSADSYDPGISVTKPSQTPLLAEDGVVIHQGISPNGDGINDFLQIDNIDQYPENKLSIMNRNGQLIFETKNYDNTLKVFDGHSSKNGQLQLPGTYFYQLDYTVGGIVKHKTGFIVLKY